MPDTVGGFRLFKTRRGRVKYERKRTTVIVLIPLLFLFFSFSFFSIPFIIFTILFSLPPSRNSDPGSHSRLFFSLPTTVRALHFYRENISAPSSLVDLRRTVLTHARRSQQLWILSFIFENKSKISPRRDSNSRTNTSSIRGLPPDYQVSVVIQRCYQLAVRKYNSVYAARSRKVLVRREAVCPAIRE